jgi:hypothetical protein
MKRITMDFETRSMVDLKKVGAYKYSLDPTTQPTCLAFKKRGDPTFFLLKFTRVNTPWKELSPDFRKIWDRWIDEGYEFSAHNSFFEKCIYDNIMVVRYGWPPIDPRKRRCTAAKAAACSLPRNLEGVGTVLKLTTQKDKLGYQAMMATCKPTKKWRDWQKMRLACLERRNAGKALTPKQQKWVERDDQEPPTFLDPDTSPDIFDTLYRYCKIDVKTEELVDIALPDLNPQEQEIWFQNQLLNWRGLPIDIPTVEKISGMMAEESQSKLAELDELTMGLVTKPGARKSILNFLALEGIELPDLKSKTVDDKLDGFELDEDMRRLLEIRKALSMASTKKYQSFIDRANGDHRVRDILLYHGASTGRDSGTGIQPQNFPRGLIKTSKARPYAAVENVIACDAGTLKLLYGDNLAILFSAVLRNMIIPSPGHELFVADFSKVEVAVIWWLADNAPGLKVLRDGLDPYKYQASFNTGKPYISISDESDDRQLGKAQVLGCLAEGTPILTKSGYKNIEKVNTRDEVWDGQRWVKHRGRIYRGQQGVIKIESENIELTPGHLILSNRGWLTAVEYEENQRTHPLESAVRMVDPKLYRENLRQETSVVSLCAAYAELKKNYESTFFGEERICSALPVLKALMGKEAGGKETEISWLIQNLERVGKLVSTISERDVSTLMTKTSRGMEVAAFDVPSQPIESFWNTLLRCAGLIRSGSPWTELITTETMSLETYESLAKKLITRTARTYDLRLSGPYNCFQAGRLIVANCGFGMGAISFRDAAWTMYRVKLTLTQSREAVKNYRTANEAVVTLWKDYESAAVRVVQNGGEIRAGKCRFIYDPKRYYGGLRFLWVELPSGRRLAYADPQIAWRVREFDTIEINAAGEEVVVKKTSNPTETLEFWAMNGKTKQWSLERTWGGTMAENITQATARDLMLPGLLRLEKRGYRGLLQVHDEGITERRIGKGSVEEFVDILCEVPPWATGMPISAKGWSGPRYRKG